MGILMSKKISSDLEACPPVFGRYTSLDDEYTSRPANFTSQYKRLTASPAGSLTSGRSIGRVAESPLRKRLKFDNPSVDAFDRPKIYVQNKACLKRPPISRTTTPQNDVTTTVVNTKKAEAQAMATSTPKPHRRVTLRMCIRRRPSYKRALQTPAKLPRALVQNVIPEEPLETEQKNNLVSAVKTQAEICAMDTIIEPLSEDEYAVLEAEASSEQPIIFGNLMSELKQQNERIPEEQPGLAIYKQKTSLKICRRNSQRHTPYETMNPKSTDKFNTIEANLIRVETVQEQGELKAPEESPLVIGQLLTELRQRIAEMEARKRRVSLPNLPREAHKTRGGLQMRIISDMSAEQAQIFGKLMIELKQRLAERCAQSNVSGNNVFESTNVDRMLRGCY